MKKNFLFLLSFCLILLSCSKETDPSIAETSYTYVVQKMGTLGTMLNQIQKDTITRMIVKGEINKADFDVMKMQMPKLKYIDLKDVTCEGNRIPDEAIGGYNKNDRNINISTIILPQSITAIGNSAFMGATGLNGTLTLPKGLKIIEGWAFSRCTGLSGSLILPDGLTRIGNSAFNSCTGFTGSLNLPNGLTVLEEYVFSHCSSFNGTLNLPENLKTIEICAFLYCEGFTGSLILPDGLTTIGGAAFEKCKGLTKLTFGKNIENIDNIAFRYCNNISGSIVFPLKLSTIKDEVFKGCDKVDAFRFPHTTPLQYYTDMLPTNATVQVPLSAVATYKATDGWKSYNIVGY